MHAPPPLEVPRAPWGPGAPRGLLCAHNGKRGGPAGRNARAWARMGRNEHPKNDETFEIWTTAKGKTPEMDAHFRGLTPTRS